MHKAGSLDVRTVENNKDLRGQGRNQRLWKVSKGPGGGWMRVGFPTARGELRASRGSCVHLQSL